MDRDDLAHQAQEAVPIVPEPRRWPVPGMPSPSCDPAISRQEVDLGHPPSFVRRRDVQHGSAPQQCPVRVHHQESRGVPPFCRAGLRIERHPGQFHRPAARVTEPGPHHHDLTRRHLELQVGAQGPQLQKLRPHRVINAEEIAPPSCFTVLEEPAGAGMRATALPSPHGCHFLPRAAQAMASRVIHQV